MPAWKERSEEGFPIDQE
uniref:Uncharacterized protein n=1 Tax=Arundo donax TaxID=35708 RepID=A0A0A9HVA4_ARUDO